VRRADAQLGEPGLWPAHPQLWEVLWEVQGLVPDQPSAGVDTVWQTRVRLRSWVKLLSARPSARSIWPRTRAGCRESGLPAHGSASSGRDLTARVPAGCQRPPVSVGGHGIPPSSMMAI